MLTLEIFLFLVVEGDEDGKHRGESPEGGASVAHEWQRDAYDRHQADGHAYIYEQVHEQAAGQAVAVDSGEILPAVLGIFQDLQNQHHIQADDYKASEKAPFLTYSTEDEVRALLRHESVSGLSAVHVTLAEKTARADGNH